MKTLSLSGRRYYIIFIDDYSRYCQVYFMKTKDEAFQKFKEYGVFVANGEQGVVTTSKKRYIGIRMNGYGNELFVKTNKDCEFDLGWAITVHKSQGMTLDAAVVDLRGAFEYGQGYVALSRVRDLTGLHLVGYNDRALQVHPDVQSQENNFKERSSNALERLVTMNVGEHLERVHRFIKKSGGSVEGGVVPKKKRTGAKKGDSHLTTLDLVKKRKNIKEIARARELKEGTIIEHIHNLFMRDEITKRDVERMISPALKRALPKINAAFKRYGTDRLSPVHGALKSVYSFDELKLARILY